MDLDFLVRLKRPQQRQDGGFAPSGQAASDRLQLLN